MPANPTNPGATASSVPRFQGIGGGYRQREPNMHGVAGCNLPDLPIVREVRGESPEVSTGHLLGSQTPVGCCDPGPDFKADGLRRIKISGRGSRQDGDGHGHNTKSRGRDNSLNGTGREPFVEDPDAQHDGHSGVYDHQERLRHAQRAHLQGRLLQYRSHDSRGDQGVDGPMCERPHQTGCRERVRGRLEECRHQGPRDRGRGCVERGPTHGRPRARHDR